MAKSYTVSSGDTLGLISIKFYGIPTKYPLIIKANSFLGDRINKGLVNSDGSPIIYPNDKLTIIEETSDISNPLNNSKSPDKITVSKDDIITLIVDNKRFQFFTSFELKSSITSFDTFTVSSPYSDLEKYKETFEPFKYKNASVYYGQDLFFNGILLAPQTEINDNSKILTISMYPKCGVLSDCTFPYSSYPLEFNNLDLKQICENTASLFGISVEFIGNAGAVFEKVSPEPTQNILDFLIGLAKQRGFIITNNKQGDLLVHKITYNKPFSYIKEGFIPFLNCNSNFNPQNYYSEITGLNPETEETESNSYTWKNKYLDGIIRPKVIDIKDVDNADLENSVKSYAGRMFGDIGKYALNISTHKNEDNIRFEAGQIINVYAPKSNIYKPYDFLIESCSLTRSAGTGNRSSFSLIIPDSYSGKIPEELPWEI